MAGKSDKVVDLSAAYVMEPVTGMDWLVVAPIVITILGGSFLLMIRRNTSVHAPLAMIIFGILTLSNGALLWTVAENGPIAMTMGRWLPPFGITFNADLAGAAFAFLAALIAFVGTIYSMAYPDRESLHYGYYPFFMLLMTGVCGAFLTGDIFNLYVWFEVLLISSFGLLTLGSTRAQLDGGVKYAVLNLLATTFFLIAVGYTYGIFGTLNMADLTRKAKDVADTAPLYTVAALFAFAFAMKAAAFPLNFWLPASYHTPKITVSAVFAGLLTKVGVYSLIRVLVMILPEYKAGFTGMLSVIAVLTMLIGAFGALAQTELKRMLGYFVISGIGSVLAGVAISSYLGITGGLLYAFHSIIVMTALYFVVGGIMKMSDGETRITHLGGYYRAFPFFSWMFLILAFGVAGLPPFSGFWPKVLLVEGAIAEQQSIIAGAILLTGFLSSIAVGRVWIYVFWRGGPEWTPDGADGAPPKPMEAGTKAAIYLPVFILTAFVFGFGVLPEQAIRIADGAAYGLIDPTLYVERVFGAAQ